MSDVPEQIVHMAGKYKEGHVVALCRGLGGDVVGDLERVTCRRCRSEAEEDRRQAEQWYRDQTDHYGEGV